MNFKGDFFLGHPVLRQHLCHSHNYQQQFLDAVNAWGLTNITITFLTMAITNLLILSTTTSNLMTCTPGYYANTFAPASTFGHPASTFGFFNQVHSMSHTPNPETLNPCLLANRFVGPFCKKTMLAANVHSWILQWLRLLKQVSFFVLHRVKG